MKLRISHFAAVVLALSAAFFTDIVTASNISVGDLTNDPAVAEATGLTTGGATTPTPLPVLVDGDGETVGVQFRIAYDTTVFDVVGTPLLGATCSVNEPAGTILVQFNDPGNMPIATPATDYCDLAFTIVGAPPVGLQTISVSVNPPPSGDGCFKADFTDSLVCTAFDAQIDLSAGPAPALTANPPGPGPIVITDIVGGGSTDVILNLNNTGDAGSTLNIGAPTGLGGELAISPTAVQAVPQGGAGVDYTISCTAAAVGPGVPQTLSFTHDGTTPASPFTIDYQCDGVAGPTAPTASLGAVTQPTGPNNGLNQVANGAVPVNIDSAGVAIADLTLTCTIPAMSPSNFQITGGGTRTINAPATVGGSAPDIDVSCVRQAAAVNATLTCTQNANPDPDPLDLTAVITCPLGVPAPNPGSNPMPPGPVNATAVTGATATGSVQFTNTGGTAPYDLTGCMASAGFTIISPPAFPVTVAPDGTALVTVSCVAPAAGTSTLGTLDCTTDAPNFAPSYDLSCNGISAVVPTIGPTGKILLASLVIGLGLLGMGLRRQA